MKKVFTVFIVLLISINVSYPQYGWYLQSSGTAQKLNALCNGYYPYTYLWAAGNNGTVLSTTNSGQNWILHPTGTNRNLNSIQFKDLLTGFAAGDSGIILRSTNGGNSWVSLNSGTTNDLLSISFEYFVWPDSAYSLWAAGKNGIILRSTNLGNTWFVQNSGTSNDLRSMVSFDFGNDWIAGSGGTLLSTSNAGALWKTMNSGTTAQLNSIQAIYSGGFFTGALAAGNNGTIIRSSNLGLNWITVNSGTSLNLYSIATQYYGFLWISGANGIIIRTQNTGLNWEQEVSPTNNNLNSIKVIDPNTGWAVGDNGTIVHTTSDNWAISSKRMDANTIGAWFSNNGTFNYNINGLVHSAGFEWARGQNHFARFASGLWIGADVGSDRLVTVAAYDVDQYLPGYTDNNGIPHGANDPVYTVYKLSYGVNDPDRQHWPNALLGNSDQGAPVYFDTQSNAWKPLDFGGQTMFYSYTDAYPIPHYDYTAPLYADIKQINFSFSQPGVMGNTIYSQYTIINRGVSPWTNTYITFWSDDDLGNSQDDKTGCDTLQQIGFTYNGVNYDTAYGSAPPAVSFDLVRGPIVYTGNNSDTAFICNGRTKKVKVKYKQTGMSVFNTYISGLDPSYTQDFYNYMSGFSIDGSPIIDPLTGLPTKFVYSGDPETNTGWVQPNIGDMRLLISVGPLTMNPGDTQVIVIAQAIAKGTNNLNSVTLLKQYAQVIRDNYNNCFVNVPIGIENNHNVVYSFQLAQNYPNPFNPTTKISFSIPLNKGEPGGLSDGVVVLKIYDILGREAATLVNQQMKPGNYEVEWDGTSYASGIYFYKLTVGSFTNVKKMVLLK